MDPKLPPYDGNTTDIDRRDPPLHLVRPYVFVRDEQTFRFAVVRIDPGDHNHPVWSKDAYGWAIESDFKLAGLTWGWKSDCGSKVVGNAAGAKLGTVEWERERANRMEAQLMAINATILMMGGYQYVRADYGHGHRQETVPEAFARLCRSTRPLGAPKEEHPQLPGEVVKVHESSAYGELGPSDAAPLEGEFEDD